MSPSQSLMSPSQSLKVGSATKKPGAFQRRVLWWAIQDWLRPSAFQGEQHNAPAIAGRYRFFMPLS